MNEVMEVIKKIDQHIMRDEIDEAKNLCVPLSHKYPNHPDILCTESIVAFKQNNMDLAFQKIRESIGLNAYNHVYYYNLIRYLLKNNRKDGLEDAVEMALQLNPVDFYGYTLMLECGFSLKNNDMIFEAINLMLEMIIVEKIELRSTFNRLIPYILSDWQYSQSITLFESISAIAQSTHCKELEMSCHEIIAIVNMIFAQDINLARKYIVKCARYRGVEYYYHLLADVWGWLGNFSKLNIYSKKAYLQNPENVPTVLLYGLSLFQQKEYYDAWNIMSARCKIKEDFPYKEVGDIYRAVCSNDRKLIVSLEQGVGDEVMYAKLLLDIVRDRPDVICYCSARLFPIISRSFPDIDVRDSGVLFRSLMIDLESYAEPFDFFYILSFAKVYLINEKSFKPSLGYIRPNDELVKIYRNDLRLNNPNKKLIIGISWRSLSTHSRHYRNIPLNQWASVISGVSEYCYFVDLQMGTHENEMNDFMCNTVCSIYRPNEILLSEIDAHMGLIACCDLVLTVDNSVAHFAAAIGIPTWVMLPIFADYRWLGQGDKSNWYEKLTLFFQDKAGDWGEVLARVESKLKLLVEHRDE